MKTFQSSLGIIALLCIVSCALQAQDTIATSTKAIVLSTPTVLDLTRQLTETTMGQHDPFEILPRVVSFEDRIVPQLREFLFQTPVIMVPVTDSAGAVKDSVKAPPPNRVYGVLALDLIGTPTAYQVLAEVVRKEADIEVRGEALQIFALNYYARALQGSIQPDKEVVHLLLGMMDDTTYVRGCSTKTGAIARQGLRYWTGIDYGELLPDAQKEKDEKSIGMTLVQSREQWWLENAASLQWNRATGCFEKSKTR